MARPGANGPQFLPRRPHLLHIFFVEGVANFGLSCPYEEDDQGDRDCAVIETPPGLVIPGRCVVVDAINELHLDMETLWWPGGPDLPVDPHFPVEVDWHLAPGGDGEVYLRLWGVPGI